MGLGARACAAALGAKPTLPCRHWCLGGAGRCLGCRGLQGAGPAALIIDFSCSATGFPGMGLERLKEGGMARLGTVQPALKPSAVPRSFCHPAHAQAVPRARSPRSRARVTACCGVTGTGRASLGGHLSTGWKSLSPSAGGSSTWCKYYFKKSPNAHKRASRKNNFCGSFIFSALQCKKQIKGGGTLPPKCKELEAKCHHSFDPLRGRLWCVNLHIHVP